MIFLLISLLWLDPLEWEAPTGRGDDCFQSGPTPIKGSKTIGRAAKEGACWFFILPHFLQLVRFSNFYFFLVEIRFTLDLEHRLRSCRKFFCSRHQKPAAVGSIIRREKILIAPYFQNPKSKVVQLNHFPLELCPIKLLLQLHARLRPLNFVQSHYFTFGKFLGFSNFLVELNWPV